MCAAPAPVGYGVANVALNATVSTTGQSINAGTISFQLKSGNTNIGSPVTSATVVNGSAGVTYPIPAGTAAGNYTVAASYNNAGAFAGSSDSSQQLAITTVPLTVSGGDATRAYADIASF